MTLQMRFFTSKTRWCNELVMLTLLTLSFTFSQTVRCQTTATTLSDFNDGFEFSSAGPSALVVGTDGDYYGTIGVAEDAGGFFYKITPAGTVTYLYTFDYQLQSADGYKPTGLVLGSDGNFYGTTVQGGNKNFGTFYVITAKGVEEVLHSFGDGSVTNDGEYPTDRLVEGSGGIFYGTTLQGGSAGNGTVYAISSSGTETVLHSFGDGSVVNDGSNPNASLVFGNDGNLYGITIAGGSSKAGTVFKITPSGVLTVLHSFGDGSVAMDAKTPSGSLVLGGDGNFYGTSRAGGSDDNGTVYRISPLGNLTVLYSFGSLTGNVDGAVPFAPLIFGTDGNLYGTTQQGGSYDFGTAFKISTSGVFSLLYTYDDPATSDPPLEPTTALTLGSDGNFYGTSSMGGKFGDGAAYRLNTGLPQPPTITSISPTSGVAGSTIVISGTNLTGSTVVTFTGGAMAIPTAVLAGSASVVVPAAAESGAIKITAPGGTATSPTAFTVIPPAPTISSFTPTSGFVGTSLVIMGTNLASATLVTFTGGSTAVPNPITGASATVVVPIGAQTGVISVTTLGGIATSSSPFIVTVPPPPTIVSFTPITGPVGTIVVVTGTNLASATSVAFTGGASAVPTNRTATSLAVAVPYGSQTGPISIITNGGTATSSIAYVVIPAPIITSFTPMTAAVGSGPVDVTISGSNLSGASAVTWNGNALTNIQSTASTVTADLPAADLQSAASAPFVVTTPGGQATSSQIFVVTIVPQVFSFSPESVGAGAPSTKVTITGTNLGGTAAVSWNNYAMPDLTVTPTTLTFVVPHGILFPPVSAPFILATIYGTAVSATPFVVLGNPVISSFTPRAGLPGVTLTVSGSNLGGASLATFAGGSVAVPISVTATTATIVVPAGAQTGTFTLSAAGGVATSPGAFTVYSVPSVASFTPSSVLAGAGATKVTLTGSGLGGISSIMWGGFALTGLSSTNTTATGTIGAAFLKAAASAPLVVTAWGGSATSHSSFTVYGRPRITSITPLSGPYGTTVTFYGSNLNGATKVVFAGGATAVPSSSATVASVVVPTGAKTGGLTITTPDGAASSAKPFTVIVAPVVSTFSPASVKVNAAATKITISGANFLGTTSVVWNGHALIGLTVSSSSVSGTIEAAYLTAPASSPITVTNAAGTATSAKPFVVYGVHP